MAINKVIYGGETLIDLTGDTVTADKILSGFTAHDKGGVTLGAFYQHSQYLPKYFINRDFCAARLIYH